MKTMRVLFAAVLLLGSWSVLAPDTAEAQKKRKTQHDVITREEILDAAQDGWDMLQLIRAIRPRYLQKPANVNNFGNSMVPPTLLVVDGNRQTGLDALQSIRPATVEEVRYMEPSKAQNQYGTAGGAGAVVVKLYRGAPPAKVAKDSTPASPE
jgi:hypothetical protein